MNETKKDLTFELKKFCRSNIICKFASKDLFTYIKTSIIINEIL